MSPEDNLRDRVTFLSSIASVWLSIKFIGILFPERYLDVLPGPWPLSALFLVAIAVAIYSICLFIAQRKFSLNTLNLPTVYPRFEVLIAAHNESSVIVDTLQNMLQIDYPNWQLTVIDDRSSDGTAKIIKAFCAEQGLSERLTVIERDSNARPGKAAALNEAFKASSADYIAIFDADARVEANCLRQAVPHLLEPDIVGLQFQKRVSNAEVNLLTRCQDFEMAFDTYVQVGRQSMNGLVELRGNGCIVLRSVVLALGGWDENSLTEDLELSNRIYLAGYKLAFAPEIIVREEAVLHAQAFYRQRRRWTEGSLRRHLKYAIRFWNPQSPLTFSQRTDVFIFLIQFAIPIWIFFDSMLEFTFLLLGSKSNITFLMLVSCIVGVTLWANIVVGVGRWRNLGPWAALRSGSLTFLYGFLCWPTIVIWTSRKILFGRRATTWVKTPRMLDL